MDPVHQVADIAAQGLEAGVGALGPQCRQLPNEQAACHALQLQVHHHQTLDGLAQVLQAPTNDSEEPGEGRGSRDGVCVCVCVCECVCE